jgi:hypothetical protein
MGFSQNKVCRKIHALFCKHVFGIMKITSNSLVYYMHELGRPPLDKKYRSVKCVKNNHNPKGTYRIECKATQTLDKCKERKRYDWGSKHPLLNIHTHCSPKSKLGIQDYLLSKRVYYLKIKNPEILHKIKELIVLYESVYKTKKYQRHLS